MSAAIITRYHVPTNTKGERMNTVWDSILPLIIIDDGTVILVDDGAYTWATCARKRFERAVAWAKATPGYEGDDAAALGYNEFCRRVPGVVLNDDYTGSRNALAFSRALHSAGYDKLIRAAV